MGYDSFIILNYEIYILRLCNFIGWYLKWEKELFFGFLGWVLFVFIIVGFII